MMDTTGLDMRESGGSLFPRQGVSDQGGHYGAIAEGGVEEKEYGQDFDPAGGEGEK